MKSPMLAALILLNICDVVLHVAVDRVEPARIAGNILIILASLFALFSGVILSRRLAMAVGLLGYIGLNGWFVVQSGIGPAGVGLITLTIVLSGLYIWRARSA